MNWQKPVAAMVLAILPTNTVAGAYRREGLAQPHTSVEVVPFDNWNFDQRLSIVSGSIVGIHHWAATVRLGSISSGSSLG